MIYENKLRLKILNTPFNKVSMTRVKSFVIFWFDHFLLYENKTLYLLTTFMVVDGLDIHRVRLMFFYQKKSLLVAILSKTKTFIK